MSAARLAKSALKIPMRIERGPTDILKALASTIKYIPKEPEYVLQDDPYLIPSRPTDRRVYILSKLSGIKTAKYMLNKHPELFYRDDAEPKVESFLPREEYNPDMEFSIEDLHWCLDCNDAVNGVIAYKALIERGVKLDDETLMRFFEMLCYTNEESLLDLVDYERSRFLPESDEQLVNQTWKTSGLASKLFKQIKEELDSPRIYSAMIAGLSKYNEHAAARQVFTDFKDNHPNQGLYQSAYVGLLNSVPRLCSSNSTADEYLDEILKHMSENLVKPDLTIFNSIFKVYRSFNCDEVTCQNAFKLINDMNSLGIQPSLFTFTYLMGILCRFKGGRVFGDMIPEIMTYMEQSIPGLEVKDERDIHCLGILMSLFANQLNSLRLANRLHRIYMKHPRLFQSQMHRARYLNNYFKLIVTTDSLENILNFYDSYVPLHFQPTTDSYEALTEALDLYQAPEDVIRRVGKDLIEYKVANRIKNDGIYRKDNSYVEAFENLVNK